LPKSVSECGNVLLIDFVGDRVDAIPGLGVLMLALWVQVRLIRVLKGLSGTLMSGQVIFFTVMLGAGTMGVSGKVMVLSSYLL